VDPPSGIAETMRYDTTRAPRARGRRRARWGRCGHV